MKKILFIEDNRTKAEAVRVFLTENFNTMEISIKESFTSGLRELFTNDYDVLLLDMSLPTREGAFSNSIKHFEQIGGHRIMSEMKRKEKLIPTILITMFSEFGVGSNFMDLPELNDVLSNEFEDFYVGYVFYSSQEEKWKDSLKTKISKLIL